MSMPEFPKLSHLTRDEAINSILTSIAMEEAALSHILNAEGEKIQHVLADKCADIQKVMNINQSVTSLIDRIIDLQIILKNKMQLAKDFSSLKSNGTLSTPSKPGNTSYKPYRSCE
ncbi:MAG: hypothetical protein LBH95_01205 [Oscillospiraceae bacterium]|jgi:hypothetical protein|nr:hypothetical protein [Oscillospiraceae bacterium]